MFSSFNAKKIETFYLGMYYYKNKPKEVQKFKISVSSLIVVIEIWKLYCILFLLKLVFAEKLSPYDSSFLNYDQIDFSKNRYIVNSFVFFLDYLLISSYKILKNVLSNTSNSLTKTTLDVTPEQFFYSKSCTQTQKIHAIVKPIHSLLHLESKKYICKSSILFASLRILQTLKSTI